MTNDTDNGNGIAIDQAFNVLEHEDSQALLNAHQRQLAEMNDDTPAQERYSLLLDIASDLLALQRNQDAWDGARACFDFFIQAQDWQKAAESCNVMFQTDHEEAVIALAHGVWLGVTFPIQPETSVALLQHIIDETPADSDGAAVAAMSAHYIADLRCSIDKAESLRFLTTQMIAKVAERHSQVRDQDMLDFWIERLELNDPALFLPRLAKILDILINDHWWFDRDELRKLIPDN